MPTATAMKLNRRELLTTTGAGLGSLGLALAAGVRAAGDETLPRAG